MGSLLRVLPMSIAFVPIASGQVQVVDRGTFTWRQDGAVVAREEFSIRRVPEPGGAAWVAQATVSRGTERIAPALRADSAGRVVRYQVEARSGADRVAFTAGEALGGRWVERGQRPGGESSREFAIPGDVFLWDPAFAHQLTLLLRVAPPTPVAVLRPGARTVTTAAVRDRGAERVEVGSASLEARRYEVRLADGTAVDAWADAQGRVLRVRTADGRAVAEREEPPDR